jgi:hypothetical protein
MQNGLVVGIAAWSLLAFFVMLLQPLFLLLFITTGSYQTIL